MNLAVLIPAFNEERTIEELIRRLPRAIRGISNLDIIVVDDGSADRTAELARKAGAFVISHSKNKGSGAAFHTGLRTALLRQAAVIATIDADLQFNPEDVKLLVEALINRELDFVSCTRFSDPANFNAIPWIKRTGNRAVTWLVNKIADTAATDVACGFRAYRREAALSLNLWSEFDHAQEVIIKLARAGFRIGEISLPVRGTREFGESKIASNVFYYGVRCLSILTYTMRDLRPLRFFGTIAAGFFAIGIFLGGFVLVHWLRTRMTAPYTSFLFGSSVGLVLSFILGALALLADMIGRQGRLLEEMWYWHRRTVFDKAAQGNTNILGSEKSG